MKITKKMAEGFAFFYWHRHVYKWVSWCKGERDAPCRQCWQGDDR